MVLRESEIFIFRASVGTWASGRSSHAKLDFSSGSAHLGKIAAAFKRHGHAVTGMERGSGSGRVQAQAVEGPEGNLAAAFFKGVVALPRAQQAAYRKWRNVSSVSELLVRYI
jgi:hypothetical protein